MFIRIYKYVCIEHLDAVEAPDGCEAVTLSIDQLQPHHSTTRVTDVESRWSALAPY